MAVVGGDGSGKTTLLRVLVGEIAPDRGSVEAPDPASIGYLPATAGSWSNLSVTENMDFVGGVYGLGGSELAERRDRRLGQASLLPVVDRLSSQLSGGMRRKLGFSMAMLHDPVLLVLDEPSTGVDPVSRVDLWRMVSEAAAAGAAVVMSTTYLDEAERAASLLALDRGSTLASGPLDEVLSSFDGVVTRCVEPRRREWAWRRGRAFHEWWPSVAQVPADAQLVTPDLEDVVISLSLQHRLEGGVLA